MKVFAKCRSVPNLQISAFIGFKDALMLRNPHYLYVMELNGAFFLLQPFEVFALKPISSKWKSNVPTHKDAGSNPV